MGLGVAAGSAQKPCNPLNVNRAIRGGGGGGGGVGGEEEEEEKCQRHQNIGQKIPGLLSTDRHLWCLQLKSSQCFYGIPHCIFLFWFRYFLAFMYTFTISIHKPQNLLESPVCHKKGTEQFIL